MHIGRGISSTHQSLRREDSQRRSGEDRPQAAERSPKGAPTTAHRGTRKQGIPLDSNDLSASAGQGERTAEGNRVGTPSEKPRGTKDRNEPRRRLSLDSNDPRANTGQGETPSGPDAPGKGEAAEGRGRPPKRSHSLDSNDPRGRAGQGGGKHLGF